MFVVKTELCSLGSVWDVMANTKETAISSWLILFHFVSSDVTSLLPYTDKDSFAFSRPLRLLSNTADRGSMPS